ncbi:hypothetical protein ACQR1Y_07365 [Bradyrhizobium sp. HKCCYLRH3099]|uniref:hypothetical protein n=1 Tax=unclassified Bradyrhizobium TaxID=2631580 RepID=UPI003EBE9747
MLPTTILIDERPRCVVRPNDTKDLNRFIRNGKTYLLAEIPDGKITHRNASDAELMQWQNALALHRAWGGDDESFFGVPLY